MLQYLLPFRSILVNSGLPSYRFPVKLRSDFPVILKNTGAIPFTAPVLSCTYFAATRCACLFPKQVAGYFVARSYFLQFRFLLQAAFRAVGATVAERTARRQIQRTGRFALDILNLLGKVHLGIKDRGQQRP